jgi:hypothetical protein
MADYKNIKGFNIQYLDSDPPNPIEGQMWYNSTSQTLKGAEVGGVAAGTWSSGGDLNSARYRMMGGAGTLTAGLAVGGANNDPSPTTNDVESYNGTSWTTSTNFPIDAADIGMTGTATASLAIGGNGPNNTDGVYNFNGSSWTSTTSLPSAGARIKAIGTQTAALAATGEAPPSQTPTNRTLEFDGTTWTTGGNYPISTNNGGCSGTQTAGFGFGGNTPPQVVAAYYNGTSWTAVSSLNTAKTESMFSGSGTQTSSMIARTTTTEAWDGTSWTELNDLATSRSAGGSFGTTSSMVAAGGYTTDITVATEEWNAPDLLIKTFTTS